MRNAMRQIRLSQRRSIVMIMLLVGLLVFLLLPDTDHGVKAQAVGPTMLDPNLSVRTAVSGLSQPTTMAFLGANDFLVCEKASGKLQRVINGVIQLCPPYRHRFREDSARG